MALQDTKNQWTISNVAQEFYLTIAVDAFLLDRKVQNMSGGTLYFYEKKLKLFCDFCESRVITRVDQITASEIRQYLLWLEQTDHNAGGIHAAFRALKTFLRWWELETEPDGWKNPIRKVKAPRLPTEPLEPVAVGDVHKLVETCKHGDFYGDRDRAMLLTLLDSGLRASELVGLDLADLNLTDGSLRVLLLRLLQ